MTCAMRLVARMADEIQVGRYSTVSINLSNILEFYLVVVENSSFMHPYYRRRKVFVSLSSILFVVVFRQKYRVNMPVIGTVPVIGTLQL